MGTSGDRAEVITFFIWFQLGLERLGGGQDYG